LYNINSQQYTCSKLQQHKPHLCQLQTPKHRNDSHRNSSS